MQRVLVPYDGSVGAYRAIRRVIEMKETTHPALEVLLINVQPQISTLEMMVDGRPSFVHKLEEPLKDAGAQMLSAAQQMLDGAGIEHRSFVECGDPAQYIADYARTYHCEMIVMGSEGMGSAVSRVPGSVAVKVRLLATTPVVLVP